MREKKRKRKEEEKPERERERERERKYFFNGRGERNIAPLSSADFEV